MTLRDDVVFLSFLYQWYTYRVDKTRANEVNCGGMRM